MDVQWVESTARLSIRSHLACLSNGMTTTKTHRAFRLFTALLTTLWAPMMIANHDIVAAYCSTLNVPSLSGRPGIRT